MADKPSTSPRPNGFPIAVVIVGTLAIGLAWLIRSAVHPTPSPALGKPFPKIEAAGWINGPALTDGDRKGHVLVVDAWAYWCGPCRAVTPTLVELNQKYKDRGVRVIGLTAEGLDPESLQQTVKTVETENMSWPNGYGAGKILSDLGVEGIPQLWVVDGQNQIVFHQIGWSSGSAAGLEQAIVDALNPPATSPASTASAKQPN